ncbi:40-kDa huntingtin-associated protein [Euwallacea similis]|uniref:40-kDa huntingtin-associated protein n=1 Tax=Euwallacea similis TaxID=1736056 RepID=UPI00344DC20A
MASSETSGYSILDQYRAISGKLKKRFLRKPNETEAAKAFADLGHQCQSQDLLHYAALSWIAAARCEGILGNNVNEISFLVRAARQFLKAEEDEVYIDCPSVSTEYLQASFACYGHASSRFAENSALPLSLNLELTDFLQKIGRNEFVRVYLDNAVELSNGRPESRLYCLEKLGEHLVLMGDYVTALQTYQSMAKMLDNRLKSGHQCNVLLNCEINSIFLLLILKPSPQNISSDYARLLEKYTWGNKSDPSLQACKMSEKLFILMQSLVTICQSVDTSSLADMESDFWPFLNAFQKDLLRTLLKAYSF